MQERTFFLVTAVFENVQRSIHLSIAKKVWGKHALTVKA